MRIMGIKNITKKEEIINSLIKSIPQLTKNKKHKLFLLERKSCKSRRTTILLKQKNQQLMIMLLLLLLICQKENYKKMYIRQTTRNYFSSNKSLNNFSNLNKLTSSEKPFNMKEIKRLNYLIVFFTIKYLIDQKLFIDYIKILIIE